LEYEAGGGCINEGLGVPGFGDISDGIEDLTIFIDRWPFGVFLFGKASGQGREARREPVCRTARRAVRAGARPGKQPRPQRRNLIRPGLCSGERVGCHEFLASRINSQIEALKRACTKERHVTRLSEHNLVNRELLTNAEDGKPDAPGEHFSVRHRETKILLLPGYANLLKFRTGNPSVLTSRIDKSLRYPDALVTMHVVLNPATYVKCTHF
jgi:hypothetical protein